MTKVYTLDGKEIGTFLEDETPTRFVTPEEYEVIRIKKGGKNGKRTELDTK